MCGDNSVAEAAKMGIVDAVNRGFLLRVNKSVVVPHRREIVHFYLQLKYFVMECFAQLLSNYL